MLLHHPPPLPPLPPLLPLTMFPQLVPIVLLTVHAALADGIQTFTHTDPVTGSQLKCEGCPPGTYPRARCTATSKSVCAPCPAGSYTEQWNYLTKCLRCGACGHYEVVRTPCTAHNDIECACREGFYYKKPYEMCMRHSACSSGQGVLSKGTADDDTVCHTCPDGTFSDVVSTHHNCTKQKSCDGTGQQQLLSSAPWHNSVCVSCLELRDGASYLREILPAFFVHHSLSIRRLGRLVAHLPSAGHRKAGETLTLPELNALVNAWIASATDEHIRQLPATLKKIGAHGASERLQNKLQRIDAGVKQLCEWNEVDAL
ncbi:tumor necrosis factor receptor superfamily member 6B isoform X2 [Paralichthys olivaceus]|uniref:tumor necrosis factor receptor superfamily member 6B isoform X2 n=1 Tax=Paralichthys olivaceus TaxID=8255 RepID=UPI0037534E1F